MLLCFDISRDAKNALDRMMATAAYRDVSEAIAAAIISYESIAKAATAGVSFTFPQQVEPPAAEERPPGAPISSRPPAAASLFELPSALPPAPSAPVLAPGSFEDVPPTRWLFGQYNKILPVKATCRAMLNLARAFPSGIPLQEAATQISGSASVLGERLREMDRACGRSREDAFSAAFPSTADGDAGGRMRFANQFVGDLRQPSRSAAASQEPKFNGMPGALKLLACSRTRDPIVELTSAGWKFAALRNPVFEDASGSPDAKLSLEEVGFLLSHIKAAIPEEVAAISSVLQGVREGANTPARIDAFICSKYGLVATDKPTVDTEIARTFLTTQRTGTVSRMIDLGLLTRSKSGLFVQYSLTQLGEQFLG